MAVPRDASMAPLDQLDSSPPADPDGSQPGDGATPLSSLPRVQLHIPAGLIPDRLATGLQQIAAHHIRPGTISISHRGPIPVQGIPSASAPTSAASATAAAAGVRGTDAVPVWCWNVVFIPDQNFDLLSWATSTSAPSFAPVSGPNASNGFVQQPFIVSVRYHPDRPCNAFRALGHVLAATKAIVTSTADDEPTALHPNLFASASDPERRTPTSDATQSARWYLSPSLADQRLNHTETANFETLGTMIDCSRNGVLNLSSVKYLCRTLALLGYNMLQLYTEDTYEIPDEPFFGYMRGGYTTAELREVDDYAYALGIEVIPCIQTLGHLGQMLQWPRFLPLRDTAEVLLAEWPETYALLEKMIAAASAPFRSRRIHLGMDETHGLGHGRYFSLFGHQNGKDGSRIFVEHLQRVHALCTRMQLEPMIWSDMLFCLSARNNSLTGYYDSDKPATASVRGIPEGLDLVYWDYYHSSTQSYATRIESHRELRGEAPWMAAGSWTWSRFWTALPFTFLTCRASLNASKAAGSGVKHAFLTIWGDEGNEVDLWSSLPAWLYYADHAFTRHDEVDVALLKARFDAVVGASFDDFVLASKLDEHAPDGATLTVDDRIHFAPNTSKWMLWSDPVCSFVEPSVTAAGIDLQEHYTWLEEALTDRLAGTVVEPPTDADERQDDDDALMSGGDTAEPHVPSRHHAGTLSRTLHDHPFNARLEMPRLLARTLALKATLRARLHEAYTTQDWTRLGRLAERTRACRDATRALWRYHRRLWMSMYKPSGWETLELRYGGLVARLDTLAWRLARFLLHLERGGSVGVPLDGSSVDRRTGVFLSSTVSSADREGSTDPDPDGWEGEDADGQPVYELPELAEELKVVYGSPDQLLDFHRVSRPTYC